MMSIAIEVRETSGVESFARDGHVPHSRANRSTVSRGLIVARWESGIVGSFATARGVWVVGCAERRQAAGTRKEYSNTWPTCYVD